MRKSFILIFIWFSHVGFCQEIGDSIEFTTYSGKHYNGLLERIEPDGYFFESSYSRSIYLSKEEIKKFQIFKSNQNKSIKEKTEGLPIETYENQTTETKVVKYSKSQLSLLTGIDNINIVLRDGRVIEGTIKKIEYTTGFEGFGDAIISFASDKQNYTIKKTEIVNIYKNVAVINPKKKIIEKGAYFNEGYSKSNEDNVKPVSFIFHGWAGFGRSGGSNNIVLGSLGELKINNIKINGEDGGIGLGIDYSYIERAERDMSPNLNEWRRIHLRANIYGVAGNENIYFGIGIGSGKGLIEVFNWWNGNQVPRYEEWKNFSFRVCLGGKYKISENFGLMGEVGIGAAVLRGGLYVKI